MNAQPIIQSINQQLAIALPENTSYEALHKLLSEYINHLIQTDFQQLVSYLYRIDIDEKKLKALLENTDEPASNVIAHLIIQRQQQKMEMKAKFAPPPSDDIDADELL